MNHDFVSAARTKFKLPDSELIDLALSALLERAEREEEDRALDENPYHLDADLQSLPAGWPSEAPPLDTYDGSIPEDVVALFAARKHP